MPLTVADTGPLNYLVWIGLADLLPQLFGTVIIPEAVRDELSSPEAPPPVREWIASPPFWLSIRPAPTPETDPTGLDAGEVAVLALASAIRADLVLMDDRAGVRAGRAQGFAVTGTIGILDRAAVREIVDLEHAIARLRTTSFRAKPQLLDALLDQHRHKT